MNIYYEKSGDIVYKKEEYTFLFQGSVTANIHIFQLIQSNGNADDYNFQFMIKDDSVPNEYRNINSAEKVVFDSLNPDLKIQQVYKTKEECLQDAINWISFIINNHSDKEINDK